MTKHPDSLHIRQVSEVVDLVVTAFMMAHQFGATDSVCCDAALSAFLRVIGVFGREQDTIDAMPTIVDALKAHMQVRLRAEAEERKKQKLGEAEIGTVH